MGFRHIACHIQDRITNVYPMSFSICAIYCTLSSACLFRPLGAAMASPSQVRCMHVDWKQSEEVHLHLIPNEKPLASARGFSFGIRQRPTLPGRLQPSTIGAERLNFCVRYGNRWDPFAIVTGILSRACAVRVLLGFRFVCL